jgi:hypothetical protein
VDTISTTDDGSHQPPAGAGDDWQESWFLGWYDPLARAGGFTHLDFQRVRGRACVWSWTALDGEVVDKYQSLSLPLPAEDMSDVSVGPVHLATKTPLRQYAHQVDHGGVRSDVVYEAFTDPFSFSLDLPGADLGAGHYESMGHVTGTVSTETKDVAVSGFAFQDHSWGQRDYGALKAHRWACATFGDDLFASIFSFSTDAGRRDYGYVFDGGRFHGIRKATFDAVVDDDGHTPKRADIRVWTDSGRGYRLASTVDVASVSTHDGGLFITDGYGVFECGGRLGTGILEVQELAGPSPGHRAVLGLDG